jgi:hypothetical protein
MQCHTTTRIGYTRIIEEDRKANNRAKTPGTFVPLPQSLSTGSYLSNITTRQFTENSLEV